MPWGGFQIAEVWARGVHVGWGATCGLRTDAGDAAECKRNLKRRERKRSDVLDDAGRVRQLKRWLPAGFAIDPHDPCARDLHMK
eukprot:3280971-Pyramimonas_sp.AAC.1